MQYETIILELMSRIKVLEDNAAEMKETIRSLENVIYSADDTNMDTLVTPIPPASRSTTSYTKTTERMIDVCYAYGKKAYRTPNANIGEYADAVAEETNMNRNSAFMYIHAVKNLLDGKVFKRAISVKALRKYFSTIYEEFGTPGLSNAIKATRANIEYRHSYDLPSGSIIALCDEFQKKI